MKYAIVTLFTFTLALGVQSSVLPWGGIVTQVAGGPLAHTAVISPGLPWHGGLVVSHPPAAVHAAVSWPGAIPTAIHTAAVPAHISGVHAVHAGIPAVVTGHAGYVAKTNGAVHTAPLAGHLNSVANVNVAPAPGTI